MYYQIDPSDPKAHGLPFDPFKALIAPRPIGWISTRSSDGQDNLAPYSYFQAVCDNPKIVMFSSGGHKDSSRNAEQTGEFVCNLVGRHHMEAMNKTSVGCEAGVDEFDLAGLAKAPSSLVNVSRVADAVASIECKVTEITRPKMLDGGLAQNVMVFGQVVAVHIADDYIVDGRFDPSKAGIVSRLGYMDYDVVAGPFEMTRPTS
jgi:flavin reductase (DIM6/NTAB) family NADH-FMN oxidoreductase RutF